MKFKIHLTRNTLSVPFNYPHQLASTFHAILGENNLHGTISLYSLGWLYGGKAKNGGLWFADGAMWEVGIIQNHIAEDFVQGMLTTRKFDFYGMDIHSVNRLEEPDFSSGIFVFKAGSPVLVRRQEEHRKEHLTYSDPGHRQLLRRSAITKMKRAGIDKTTRETLSVYFDPHYRNPRTKLVEIKGIKNRASLCPVVVRGAPEVIRFLYTAGAGDLTGMCFGSLIGHEPYPGAIEKNSSTSNYQTNFKYA